MKPSDQRAPEAPARAPFMPGAMVIATLGNPREKIWGVVLSLKVEGLSLCGVELSSFDELISMVKHGEPFSSSVLFFPMHRIERIELDLPNGNAESLSQRFTAKTELNAVAALLASCGLDLPELEDRP